MVCCCAAAARRPELIDRLRQRAVPVVHVMTWPAPTDRICVGFDNARAMKQAVKYLIDMGHRRIAMLAGITHNNDRAAARVRGFREALAAARITLPASRLVERRYSLDQARDGMRELMATGKPPTAIVCGNDVLAFGALLEAQRLGCGGSAATLDHRLRRSRDGAPPATRAHHRAGSG